MWPRKANQPKTVTPFAHEERLHEQLAVLKLESLQRLSSFILKEFQLVSVMAAELEFYLLGDLSRTYPATLLSSMDAALRDAGIKAHPAEQERGARQYEIALHPTDDLVRLAKEVHALPKILSQALQREGFDVTFAPKPLAEDFGSGAHWHIHMESAKLRRNIFSRSEEGRYSKELLWIVSGMLELLPESMIFFAAHPQAYARFAKSKLNAPTHISWGPNNRTAAIRLPNKALNDKHLEHRVAGADADPWMCILAILAGVAHGLTEKEFPIDAVYGDASDDQYALELIPDFATAVDLFKQSTMLPEYIGKELCGEYLSRVVYPDAY